MERTLKGEESTSKRPQEKGQGLQKETLKSPIFEKKPNFLAHKKEKKRKKKETKKGVSPGTRLFRKDSTTAEVKRGRKRN